MSSSSILDRDADPNSVSPPNPVATSEPVTSSTVSLSSRPPLLLQEDDSPNIVIPLIVLIIFVAFLGWMLYLLIQSNFQATTPSDPVTSDNRTATYMLCPPGECGVNLTTGFKTCPESDDVQLAYDPASQICSGRFVCDNVLAPYAVQSDGSTDINGVCEPNVACPCLKVFQCPDYVVAAFTSNNGNPYSTSLTNQRITFPQITSYTNTTAVSSNGTATNSSSTIPPIQFNNPSTTFCAAPISWLPFSNPGCNFIGANDVNSMTYNDVLICMGMKNGECYGFTGNPCMQGILAIVTDNPDQLTQSNINQQQYACVAGTSCDCGEVNIYDTGYGGIICRSLPP